MAWVPLERRRATSCQMFGPSQRNQSDWLPSLETFTVLCVCNRAVAGGDRRCCASPPNTHFHLRPNPHDPPLLPGVCTFRSPMPARSRPQLSSPVWSVWRHVTLPEATQRSLLPLKTECKIINRFGFSVWGRGGGRRLCLRERRGSFSPKHFECSYYLPLRLLNTS